MSKGFPPQNERLAFTLKGKKKIHAALLNAVFFTRSRWSVRPKYRVLWKREKKKGRKEWTWKRVKNFRVRRIVLYVTSLLSVSTESSRAAVVGNCSSLLPGAPRVQSRIHEFLVRTPPLRSFFTYTSPPPPPSSFPLSPPPSLSLLVPPRCPVSRPLFCACPGVCTENISRIECAESCTRQRNRVTSIGIRAWSSKMQSGNAAAFMPSRAPPPPSPRRIICIAYRRNNHKTELVYRAPLE